MSEYIYVIDKANSRIIKRLASNMNYARKVGTYGNGNDQFANPTAATNDGTYLYIVDEGNYRIVKRRMDDLSYVSQIGISPNWRPNPPMLGMPLTTPAGRTELFVNPGFNYLPEYTIGGSMSQPNWGSCVVGHWYGAPYEISPRPLPTSNTSGCIFAPNTYIFQLVTLIVGKKYEVLLPGHTTNESASDATSFNIMVGANDISSYDSYAKSPAGGRFTITPELSGQTNGTSIVARIRISFSKNPNVGPRTLRFASLTEIPNNYEPSIPDYRPIDNNDVILPQDVTNDGTYLYISSDSGYIFKRSLADLSYVNRFSVAVPRVPLETPSGRAELFTDPAFNWRVEYYMPMLRDWRCAQVQGRWYGFSEASYGDIYPTPLPVSNTSGCGFYRGSFIWQIVTLTAGKTYEVRLPNYTKGIDASNPDQFYVMFGSNYYDPYYQNYSGTNYSGIFTATVSGPTYIRIGYTCSWGNPMRILKFASLTEIP